VARPREHDQVRRGPPADQLRLLLERRGRRCRLARRRSRAARRDRIHRGALVLPGASAPAPAVEARARGGEGVKYARAFLRFWWDFIVGDDWRVAAGIAVALGLTAALTDYGWSVWWLLPLAVAVLLGRSLQRA